MVAPQACVISNGAGLMLFTVACLSGFVTVIGSLALIIFCFLGREERLFPEKRPRWLELVSWLYLTLAFCSWQAVFAARTSASVLICGILTLQAAKLLILFFYYYGMREILVALFRDRRGALIITISACSVGALILYAGMSLK